MFNSGAQVSVQHYGSDATPLLTSTPGALLVRKGEYRNFPACHFSRLSADIYKHGLRISYILLLCSDTHTQVKARKLIQKDIFKLKRIQTLAVTHSLASHLVHFTAMKHDTARAH